MKSICRSILGFCLMAVTANFFPVHAEGQTFEFGVIERLRNEYFNNALDFNGNANDKQDFFRIRTSIWGRYTASPNFAFYAKLTNEWRHHMAHPNPAVKGFDDFHEVFVDNFYAKISGGDKTKYALILGRQDIIFGEGFVMLEGNPLDGSRCLYHNAARLTIQTGPNTIDVFGISNPHKDKFILINDKKQGLNNLWEQGYGAYVTNTSNPDLKVEGYVIHKREDAGGSIPTLKLNTVGARLSRPMKNNISFASELAGQFGKRGVDQRGLGGYAYVKYLLSAETDVILTAGAYYLSGDDPGTADYEGWNPLFSRWPKWSELYIYSRITEHGRLNNQPLVAYWTNAFSPYMAIDVDLSKPLHLQAPRKLTFTGTYYHMRAIHSRPGAGATRGNELQALFRFGLHRYVNGHFVMHYFMPGNFYQTRDNGIYMRGDITISI